MLKTVLEEVNSIITVFLTFVITKFGPIAIFIASTAGYNATLGNIVVISLIALIASVGTPAAPGAILAYSLILAINRPIEMIVTSLNVVGDAATSVVVAKSEGMLDEEIYNAN